MSTNLKHSNPDPLHSDETAGPYIGRNPRTMANMRARGEGPDYLKIGRLVRYRQSSLDKYLDECEIKLGAAS